MLLVFGIWDVVNPLKAINILQFLMWWLSLEHLLPMLSNKKSVAVVALSPVPSEKKDDNLG